MMLGKLVCSGDHEHQTVEGTSGGMLRSVRTQVYPQRLLKTILGGLACHEHYEAHCYTISQETIQKPLNLKGENLQRVRTAIKKMHVNLGHASIDDMTRILRHHGAQAPVVELVKAFKCDVCDARKAPKAVKDSSVPRDLTPLRYIGIDVKWLPTWKKDYNIKALNIVCRSSGFQQMYPFRETENSELLVRLYRYWTRAFGRPRYCKFDASRCNLGQPFLDMLERDGTTALDIPGEAHEQMGDVEVQGTHFCAMLVKVIDEVQPDDYNKWLECVDVTTEAKNMLMRRGGYSANQMVFGRDPEVPGDDLLGDNPNPISNGAILEDAVAEFAHRARMSARQAVLETLDHRAARIALNARPRPLREFRPGDEVAVWRRGRGIKKNMARWRGPGVVAGEAGGNYWVSMPGSFIKCSPEQLRLRTNEEREADRFLVRDLRAAATQLFPEVGASNKTQKNFMDITKDDYPPGELFVHQPEHVPDCRPEITAEGPIPMSAGGSQPSQSRQGSTGPETISSDLQSLVDRMSSADRRQISQMSEQERQQWEASVRHADRLDGIQRSETGEPNPKRTRAEPQLVGGQMFPPALPSPPTETPVNAPVVISSASGESQTSSSTSSSSSSSSSSRSLHVGYIDSSEQAVAFSTNLPDGDESDFLLCEAESEVLIAGGRKEFSIKDSKWQTTEGKLKLCKGLKKEITNVVDEKKALRPLSIEESRLVRQQMPDRIVPSRMVLVEKVDDAGDEVVKARWTARGDKDPDLFSLIREGKTQSPTISTNGRYIVLQTIASCQFVMQLGDVTGAFLEADEIERSSGQLFMSAPRDVPWPDYDPEQLFEIIKPLYGLNDSPQKWFGKFQRTVTKFKWRQSKLDPCVYMLWDERQKQPELIGILGVHVDDVLIGGRGELFESTLQKLREAFPFRKWKVGAGSFCGSELKQDAKTFDIEVSQESFAENMSKPKLRMKESPLIEVNDEEVTSLKSVLGAALWLAKETRPDLAVQVSQGQQLLPKPLLGEAKAVANVVRRAKQFKNLTWKVLSIPFSELRLCLHSDAAFANAKKKGTQAGYLIGVTTDALQQGQPAPWSPATWKSYRLKRVVGSTFAGETQVLTDGLGHAEWIGCHLAEVKHFEFSLKDRESFLHEFKLQAITDCKSIYDHLQNYAHPGSVSDKRVAIDLVIMKETMKRLKGCIRWAPTWLQLADALTKENAEAMDILRGAMVTNQYHLNPESVILKHAAEQREIRVNRRTPVNSPGSNVLVVLPQEDMVKVSTQGLKEEEIRSLFEHMVTLTVKDSNEFLQRMTQTRSMCRMKIPLTHVDEKKFRGENALTTLTYTKNTNMITVQAGAVYLDGVEDMMNHILREYKQVLETHEIVPLPEGAKTWGTAMGKIMTEGARSIYLEENVKAEEGKVKGELESPAKAPTPFVPSDEAFHAAIAELCHEGSRKLHEYPKWKKLFLHTMLKDFGANPDMIMELSGLTEEYSMATDDEWAEVKTPGSQASTSGTKPKAKASGYRT